MKRHIMLVVLLFVLVACGRNSAEMKLVEKPEEVSEIETQISKPEIEPEIKPEPEIEEELLLEDDLTEEIESEEIEQEEPELLEEETVIQESKPIVTPVYGSAFLSDGTISNKSLGWGFRKNTEHQPPPPPEEFDIYQFNAYYLGDTSEKVVYLTFDEGYENGYTGRILDVLKEKDAHAAFFMTGSYIKRNPELVQRIANEGHLGVNHSYTHPSFPELTEEQIIFEIEEPARIYQELTGQEMPKYIRPPQGVYSARALQITSEQGYKSIFWSFAYQDWLVDNQPTPQEAHDNVLANHHNGAIILLHAVSSANTDALPQIIDSLRDAGYRFGSLEEL